MLRHFWLQLSHSVSLTVLFSSRFLVELKLSIRQLHVVWLLVEPMRPAAKELIVIYGCSAMLELKEIISIYFHNWFVLGLEIGLLAYVKLCIDLGCSANFMLLDMSHTLHSLHLHHSRECEAWLMLPKLAQSIDLHLRALCIFSTCAMFTDCARAGRWCDVSIFTSRWVCLILTSVARWQGESPRRDLIRQHGVSRHLRLSSLSSWQNMALRASLLLGR